MAYTSQDIQGWLKANPTASDATIAQAMDKYGVTPAQMAEATGQTAQSIQQRYNTAAPSGAYYTSTLPEQAPTKTYSAQEINNWLQSNQGASDAAIAQAMDKFGVTPAQMAAATGLTAEQVQQRYNAAAPSGAYFVQPPPVKPAVVKPTTLPPLTNPFSFANNRPAPGSSQFYQPAYQPQYQNYANPYTAFGVSTYGTQPMMSNALQTSGQQNVTNSVNSWLQQNPGADMNTMLNAMRGVGMNAYDVQAAGGYGNYAPQSSVFGQPMQGGMPQMSNPYSVQQPQTNYGPSRAIVSRSASMRGTPSVMARRAEGGIASLVGDE